MGIQGLLPFLKEATQPVNMRKYSGHTVAVDTYCWLHKGAFACSLQLAKGEKTDMYVRYCLKFVNMLRTMDVRPILVFDGCTLPAKKHVEKSRREKRELYNTKGRQFLREGKMSEARDCFNKCISVTPQMALEVMKAARSLGVDCIVAPYEADAQLAYMHNTGIVQAVITEDSDLVAFGCKRVIYKMDMNGNGLEIDSSKLHLAMKIGAKFTPDKFRYMCIVAGCDYLPSLPGIGLGKARKLFQLVTNPDLSQVIKRMPGTLKLKQTIPDEYVEGFHKANKTFLYQLAFDPRRRKLVPHIPYAEGVDPADLEYAGKYLEEHQAYQIALGNLDINTMKRIFDFKPDRNKSYDKTLPRYKLSIWHKDYRTGPDMADVDLREVDRQTTKGKQVTVKIMSRKRPREEDLPDVTPTDDDLASMYSNSSPATARQKPPQQPEFPQLPQEVIPETPSPSVKTKTSRQLVADKLLERAKSPRKSPRTRRRNVFAVKGRNSVDRREQIMKDKISSRFFTPPPSEELDEPESDEDYAESNNNNILQDGVCKLETSESEQMDYDNEEPHHKAVWAWGDAVAAPIRSATLSTLDKLQQYQRTKSLPVLKSMVKVEGQSFKEEDGQRAGTEVNDQVKEENMSELSVETKDINSLPSSSRKSGKTTPSGRGAFNWRSSSRPASKSRKEKPVSGQGLARFMRTSSNGGTAKMSWNNKKRNINDEVERKENTPYEDAVDVEFDATEYDRNSQCSNVSYNRSSQGEEVRVSQDSESQLRSSLRTSQSIDMYSLDADVLSLSQFGVSRNSQVLNSQDHQSQDTAELEAVDDYSMSQGHVDAFSIEQLRASSSTKSQDILSQDSTNVDQLETSQITNTSSKINQDTKDNDDTIENLPKLPSIQDIVGDIPESSKAGGNSKGLFSKTRTLTNFYQPKPLNVSSKQNSQDQSIDQDLIEKSADQDEAALSEIQSSPILPSLQDNNEDILLSSDNSKCSTRSNNSQDIFSPATNGSSFYSKKSGPSLTVSASRRNSRRKKDVTDSLSSYFGGSRNGYGALKDDESDAVDTEEEARDSGSGDTGDSINSSSETTDVECIDLTDCEEAKVNSSKKKQPKQMRLLPQHSSTKKTPASSSKLQGACKPSGLSKRRTSQPNKKKKSTDENDPRQTSLFAFMKKSAPMRNECEKKRHPSDGPLSPSKTNIITEETPEGDLSKKDVRKVKRVIFS